MFWGGVTIRAMDPERVMAGEDLTKAPANPDPASAEQEDDGLILWMLSLTPTQRLEVAQGFVDSVRALRNGRRV
jgi:hypothetical protein